MSQPTDVAQPKKTGGQRGYPARRGYVVSDKMDKTVVVEVEDRVGTRQRRSSGARARSTCTTQPTPPASATWS
jgi:hypothetical protein